MFFVVLCVFVLCLSFAQIMLADGGAALNIMAILVLDVIVIMVVSLLSLLLFIFID